MQRVQQKEIERIGVLIARGLEGIDIVDPQNGGRLFAYSGELKKALLGTMNEAAQFGRRHVAEEMKRQDIAAK